MRPANAVAAIVAAFLAIQLLAAAPLVPSPAPSPSPLKDIAVVRAHAFCSLSQAESRRALDALSQNQAGLARAVDRIRKTDTENSGAMHLTVARIQDEVHATLARLQGASDDLRRLRERAESRSHTPTGEAASAVIAELNRDVQLQTELMNRLNDYAENYLMFDMVTMDESEAAIAGAVSPATPKPAGAVATAPPPVSLLPERRTDALSDEFKREEAYAQHLQELGTFTVDVTNANIAELRAASDRQAAALDALRAVCR